MCLDIGFEYLHNMAAQADLRLDVGEAIPRHCDDPEEAAHRENALRIINANVTAINERAERDICDAFGNQPTKKLEQDDIDAFAVAILVGSSVGFAPLTQRDAKVLQSAKEKNNFNRFDRIHKLAKTIITQGESAEAGNPEFAWIGSYLIEIAGRPDIVIDRGARGNTITLSHDMRALHRYSLAEIEEIDIINSKYRGLGEMWPISERYSDATAEIEAKSKADFAQIFSGVPVTPTVMFQAITHRKLYQPTVTLPENLVLTAKKPDIGENFMKKWHSELVRYGQKHGIVVNFDYN